MSTLFRIFIGYDAVESVAWHTLAHSIYSQSSIPVAIVPLNLSSLSEVYDRPRDAKQSNSFSYTRFLVPFLSEYSGISLYLDCDMLLRGDVKDIMSVLSSEPDKAVYVVKHDYIPRDSIKYLGNKQEAYPRKNWSSVMLFNCDHPSHRILNPQYVSTASPATLHRFGWLEDTDVGSLDRKWNWLVGEYDNPPPDVRNVHWTIGGPYFDEYRNSDFSADWFRMRDAMMDCEQIDK